jgi:proline dehydrogenase
MRRALLWMAANPWLRRRLTGLWITKKAVKRFMPGQDLEAALQAGLEFKAEGLATLFTRLGENVSTIDDAN